MIKSPFSDYKNDNIDTFFPDETRMMINKYVRFHLNNFINLDTFRSDDRLFTKMHKTKAYLHMKNVGTLMVYSKRLLSVRWSKSVHDFYQYNKI
jgi:hypothetical protein